MSEHSNEDTTAGYDAGQDQDADPESLQPRSGARAGDGEHVDVSDDTDEDPDSDPDMLNPRTGDEASAAQDD